MITYKTFKRSCNNFKEFFKARKITVDTRLTYTEALKQCEEFNNNRTTKQIKKGTKLEFERE